MIADRRRVALTRGTALAAGALLALAVPAAAAGVDWSKVEGKEVILFYPGQSSFEWMLVEAEHSGGPKIRKGKTCVECHADEEPEIGQTIVSGEKLEPDPIAGKRPAIPVEVKTAHDGEELHVRLEWPAAEGSVAEKMDAEHPVKVALMFTDDSVRAAELAGCWATCHDDLVSMPSELPDADLSKYLSASRTEITRQGGGQSLKVEEELRELLAQGVFMEFWQAEIGAGGGVEAEAGHVLEERHEADDPLVSATAEKSGGRWVVVLSRPLEVSGEGRKTLEPGKTYVFGIAIHDQYAEDRFHHVSLERTLRLDEGEADFVAKRP